MNFNTQIDLVGLDIQKHILIKCDTANAYLDLRFNQLIKKYGVTSDEQIKELKIKDNYSDVEIIQILLKKRGYSKYGNIYTKGFVFVTFGEDKELKQINIKHDIKKSKWLSINDSFVTGLVIGLNYFERI